MDVTPQKQQEAFQAFFKSRFPAVALKDYADGPYPFDDGMKRQWQDIMQLPPSSRPSKREKPSMRRRSPMKDVRRLPASWWLRCKANLSAFRQHHRASRNARDCIKCLPCGKRRGATAL
jgi:hypothetical protein